MLRRGRLIRRAPVTAVLGTAVLGALAACTASSGPHASTPAPRRSTTVSASSTATTATPTRTTAPQSGAQRVFDAMTERERVGQLLMVDSPSTAVGDATRAAVADQHVGAVILDGTSTAGLAATRRVTDRLRALAPRGVGLLIATDQEGGQVQRLQGSGFSRVPSAVAQGAMAAATLQRDAQEWGAELRRAGVDVDLAPVLDTVPPGMSANPPIGDLDREYGRHPATVTPHGVAVLRGLAAAHVAAAAKHFPGLGRVSGNTDTAAGVTDSVTTRDDAYLAPFRAAVQAHVPFVMMSSAIYTHLDPGTPAAFSHAIVTGLLRDALGFRGVVISDDLGAAKQVAGYSPGDRAVRFVAAGGDMVLTVDASQAAAMCDALAARASSDTAFRALVDAAALRVLQAKQALGLLG